MSGMLLSTTCLATTRTSSCEWEAFVIQNDTACKVDDTCLLLEVLGSAMGVYIAVLLY